MRILIHQRGLNLGSISIILNPYKPTKNKGIHETQQMLTSYSVLGINTNNKARFAFEILLDKAILIFDILDEVTSDNGPEFYN